MKHNWEDYPQPPPWRINKLIETLKPMNILFLTLVDINSITDRGIYTDLLRYFATQRHNVSIVTPKERRYKTATNLRVDKGVRILQVRTFNIKKTSFLEKGLGTLAVEYQYLAAIREYLHDTKFDVVLYSTPPITFGKVIKAIKKRDGATSYLLLKDIFPQNAVDLGMIKRGGLLHRFFRHKETQLYRLSDYIGCMSPANVAYVLAHNTEVDAKRIEICPNSIEPDSTQFIKDSAWRRQYTIPEEATVFIYGGNLGKPQGLDFLIEVLASNVGKADRFFIVVGSGTERSRLEAWFAAQRPDNAILLEALPKLEYDNLVRSCDVGLIFLDGRFTIPNYPSRLLTYMENRMPVLMATDVHTDIGSIAAANGYGLWCESGQTDVFSAMLDKLCSDNSLIKTMGDAGYRFLEANYTVERSYEVMMRRFEHSVTNF